MRRPPRQRLTIVPRHAVAQSGKTPPSEKLNIAGIGVAGQGRAIWTNVAGENIVALCDVDLRHAADTFKRWPKAKQFRDFRKMFDEMEKQIDAVRRRHARPLPRRGRHGRHQARQARLLREAAGPLGLRGPPVDEGRQGAQGRHAAGQPGPLVRFDPHVLRVDLGRGDRQRAHDPRRLLGRELGATPAKAGGGEHGTAEVPATLDWDLWLGPAQQRPYHPAYLPGSWRGWVPFGNGTIGDWICHVVDPVFWALDLGAPKTIQAKVKDYDPKTQGDAFPTGEIITYEFPAKGKRGPITMYWYSGTEQIPRPEGPGARTASPWTPARSCSATRGRSCTARTGPARCGSSPRRR